MIEVGEETGDLDVMLMKVADNYDEEVDVAVQGLTRLIEPFLVVFLGGVIGTIVLALFLPLVKMIESVSQGLICAANLVHLVWKPRSSNCWW